MINCDALVKKLEAYTFETGSFHADRQLSDEVLLATGWSVGKDDSFEGGIRWFFGANPQVSCSETTRPHVIHDIGRAIGGIPFRWNMMLSMIDGVNICRAWPRGTALEMSHPNAEHSSAEIAICIVAVRAWQARAEAAETRAA